MFLHKNHALILENDLSASRIETYITWLLTEASDMFPKKALVVLAAYLMNPDGDMQLREISDVIFSPMPIQPPPHYVSGETEDIVSSANRDVSCTNTFEVLRAAGIGEEDIQKLVNDNTEIQVTLKMCFKQGRKKKMLDIDDAKRLLRNVPDDEMTLVGKSGRQKNGKISKLSYPANILTIGSILDREDVARSMVEAFHSFISNGYIEADHT